MRVCELFYSTIRYAPLRGSLGQMRCVSGHKMRFCAVWGISWLDKIGSISPKIIVNTPNIYRK